VQNYNRLLDDYLTATITSLVTVKQAPIVVRENFSARILVLALAGIIVVSCLLAVALMGVEHLFQKIAPRHR
jgi:hypothetical protein